MTTALPPNSPFASRGEMIDARQQALSLGRNPVLVTRKLPPREYIVALAERFWPSLSPMSPETWDVASFVHSHSDHAMLHELAKFVAFVWNPRLARNCDWLPSFFHLVDADPDHRQAIATWFLNPYWP